MKIEESSDMVLERYKRYKYITMVSSVFFILFFLTYSAIGSVLKEKDKKKLLNKVSSLQIPFIENKGQIEGKRVKYYARTFGGTVFVTKDGKIVYSVPNFEKKEGVRGWLIQESFLGSSISHVKGGDKAITKVNYFKGDPSKWRRNIPTYNVISLGEIYKGIELELKAYGKNVEKLFYVKPNAHPESIKVKIEGNKSLKVNEKGELEVETGLGVVRFTKPVAYQEENGKRNNVEVAYVVKRNEYSFKLADYDRSNVLVIDPFIGSTFHGGSDNDEAYSVFQISGLWGGIYVAGESYSDDLSVGAPGGPIGPDWSTNSGHNDAFVSLFSKNLNGIVSSTYLGGSSSDRATSLSVDNEGNVYVAGWTYYSTDFPTTYGAFDRDPGWCKAFITKFNGFLNEILASTYLGGGIEDYVKAYSISSDSSGNVYVAGEALAPGFPTTPGAYDTTFNDATADAFVSKLDGNLQNLVASTFLGGTQEDVARSISIDSSGNVYVAGVTRSPNFPTNAYDTGWNGGADVFVSKLDDALENLLASTFLGGSSGDEANSIFLGSGGNVYVAGESWSSNFPTTDGVFDRILNSEGEFGKDAFISKLNGNLQNLLASTFLGGSYGDAAHSIFMDGSGNVYVAGMTNALKGLVPQCMSSDFPVTTGACDTTFNNGACIDAFVSKLDGDLQNLLASTFLGGDGSDRVNSIFLDSSGDVYVAGGTSSEDFPVTSGAFSELFSGGVDAFISKLDSNLCEEEAPVPGKFDFNDGTSQGWTLQGAYDENGNGPLSSNFIFGWKDYVNYPNPPGGDPSDDNNGSIQLFTTAGHGINNPGATWWIMQFHSPDLSSSNTWQTAKGYSVQIAECMAVMTSLSANLNIKVYDIDQDKDRYFYSGTAQELQHDIYGDGIANWNHLTFDWSEISDFPTNYVVKEVFVIIWGNMSGGFEDGVYLDEVMPILGMSTTPDLDGDGDADGLDLAAFASAFGSTSGDLNYNPGADFDNNGNVDENDLAVFATDFSQTGRGPVLYFADAAENPGSIYKIENGTESTYYNRTAGKLYSFAFSPERTLYYSNTNDYDLYKLEGGEETLVYHHNTYLRDVAFDSKGRIYFSESRGSGGNGYIYRLEDGVASLYYTVLLSDVGSWAGDFTFDRNNNLYLSNGNRAGANIYKVVDEVPQIVFSAPSNEPIKGISFDPAGNLFYASWLGGNIYQIDLSTGERRLFYSNPDHSWLSDVFVW